jgi:hypothetical protein
MEHQERTGRPRRRAREGGEPPRIQIDVQIAYDLHFGRSTYARKANEINIRFVRPQLL